MSAVPSPKPGALEGITQYELYDANTRVRVSFDGVTADAYPDSGYVWMHGGSLGEADQVYNLRTNETLLSRQPDVVRQYGEILRSKLQEQDINVPEGYPEIAEVISRIESGDMPAVPAEELTDQQYAGSWFVSRITPRRGSRITREYHLFRLQSARIAPDDGSDIAGEVLLERAPLGLERQDGEFPIEMALCEYWQVHPDDPVNPSYRPNFQSTKPTSTNVYPLGPVATPGGRYGSPEAIQYHPIDAATAEQLLRLREPDVDPFRQIEHGREQNALTEALLSLQFVRWQQWDASTPGSYHESMNYAAYSQAINKLVDRFGEPFFREVSWSLMRDNLSGTHTEDMEPGLRHKPHSDIRPRGIMGEKIARTALGDITHPLAERTNDYGYAVNVLPLFGDVDFWQTLHTDYPGTYDELSSR